VNEVDLHIPDEMGAWEEDGARAWLPKLHYPTRHDARKFWMEQTDLSFTEIRVVSRYMKYTPRQFPNTKLVDGEWVEDGTYDEDHWTLCDASDEGAFPVWECE